MPFRIKLVTLLRFANAPGSRPAATLNIPPRGRAKTIVGQQQQLHHACGVDYTAAGMVVLGQEECARIVGDSGSFTLRIGGLFAILAGSAVMTFLPLVLRRGFDTALLLGSCFATGVILSTAFNHMLPDAEAAMTSPCLGVGNGYPWSFLIAGAMVIVSLMVENTLKGFMFRKYGVTDLQGLTALDEADVKRQSLQQADKVLTACFLEGGIVFHSVFVGINYGISDNQSTSVALMIALIFHQGFDGLALGTAFARAKFSNLRYIIFGTAFVLVTPFGIALGIGISTTYAPGSKAALGCEATFNSISAGLLVYNALINLIVPQYPPVNISHRPFLEARKYFALTLGYAAMAIIANWA